MVETDFLRKGDKRAATEKINCINVLADLRRSGRPRCFDAPKYDR
jgi:hypothetical protein